MAWPYSPLGVVVELYLNGAWVDVTSYVRHSAKIDLWRGYPRRADRASPGRCTLRLNNRDGRFSPGNPTGPYYGHIGRNTPLRVSVTDAGLGLTNERRWHGEVPKWPSRQAAAGQDIWVDVTAYGITYRLGAAGTPPVRSSSRHTVEAAAPVAYWPLEDAAGASSMASATGGTPMAISGSVTPAGDSSLAGTGPLPTLGPSASLTGLVPAYAASTSWKIGFSFKIPSAPSAGAILADWRTPGGTVGEWQVVITPGSPDTIKIVGYNNVGAELIGDAGVSLYAGTGAEVYDQQLYMEVTATQDGSDLDWAYVVYSSGADGGGNSGTEASCAIANVTLMLLVNDGSAGLSSVTFGHSYVLADATAGTNVPHAAFGWPGETAADRVARLCDEHGVTHSLVGTAADTAAMGAQRQATLLTLLQDCAMADGGLLYEPSAALGLEYRTRTSLYGQGAQLALTYDADGELTALDEPDDTADLANAITVTRRGGSSATAELATGALSVQDPPDGAGRYESDVTLDLAADGQLADAASWALHLATIEDERYTVRVDLANMAAHGKTALVVDAVGVGLGDRVTIDGTPAWLPPYDVDQLANGIAERLGGNEWTIDYVGVPSAPWQVWTVEDPVLGRLDTTGSYLHLGVTASATSMLVATGPDAGPLWSTTAEPYDWWIAGERVTCAAMATNAVSYVGAGSAAHDVNAPVTPGIPAGLAAGDLLVVLAAIRNSGTGTVDLPSGWTSLAQTGNMRLLGKVHDPEYTEGFESGVADWTATNGTFAQSSAQKRTGTYSGLLTVSGSPSQAYVRKRYAVTAGQAYGLSMWCRSGDGHSDLSAAIDWYNGESYLSTSNPGGTLIAAGTFEERAFVATAPGTATHAEIGPTLGSSPPTGETLHLDDVQFFAVPAVTFSGGAAGADTSAQMAAWRNAQLYVVTSSTQLNGSAADIATPALTGVDRDGMLIITAGWKQDDWTGVTSPGTEVGEPDTTTGDDQGLVWAYTIQTTATDVDATSFVVTGGTNQISRAAVLALPGDVQTATVTRAVNGISKAQSAGADVRLWRPGIGGLAR